MVAQRLTWRDNPNPLPFFHFDRHGRCNHQIHRFPIPEELTLACSREKSCLIIRQFHQRSMARKSGPKTPRVARNQKQSSVLLPR